MDTLRDSTVSSSVASNVSIYMRQVYNWMTVGLLATAASAYYVSSSPVLMSLIFGSKISLILLVVATIGMAVGLSAAIHKMSATVASLVFLTYSVLNGAMLSSVLLIYTGTSVFNAFAVTSATFLSMSVYGSVTKRDLTSMGSFLYMGLFGVIIAMVVNIFLQSSAMQFVISALCVVIFTGLTAYDTQKLREFGLNARVDDPSAMRRGALLGALTLYLDFINLFMALLQLFGNRR